MPFGQESTNQSLDLDDDGCVVGLIQVSPELRRPIHVRVARSHKGDWLILGDVRVAELESILGVRVAAALLPHLAQFILLQ